MAVPAFRRLWLAGLVSDTGDWLMFIALPLVVLQLTGSAVGTSFAFLLELAPPVLLAPVIARVTDRLSHRLVMVVAMVGQALTLLPLLLVHAASDLPVVYGVIVAQASFGAFFLPAKNALLPTLVGLERANSANALVGLNNDFGRIVGGPLGGVLLAVGSLSAIALMDVASYVVAAALVLSLPRRTNPGGPPSTNPSVPKPSGVLHALNDRPTLHLVLVNTVASVAQGLFLVLFVFFVTDVIRGNEADVGLLRGVQAIGAIGAGLALGVLGAKINALRLTLIGASTFTVITVLCWNASFVTHAVPLYALLFATIGVPAVFMGAGLTSLLQQATRGAHRGSAFAALGLGQAIGQAIGITAAGLLQEPLGTLPLLEVQAGTYALTALLAFVLLPRRSRAASGRPALSEPAPSSSG
ncbi:MFS transporter [Curtobacterium sp. VKM Ac-2887]|uniref:MFS transporter n=1 Tax=Curtobacterium sp. VKM Ac-2887 TaxID=2783819 RepID=UPI00188AD6CF|nr:MFS transporter [Curtobacterium sp. VKM Ac-2887]MBF4588233.1 MFS transporter [Curtobacterium sp. VKM Ac-2887]